MRQQKSQIHLYKVIWMLQDNYFREETNADNAKLKRRIKDMEDQFHKIRDDFTTERTTRDSLAEENGKLKEEIEAYKAQLVVEKQQSLYTQNNVTQRKQKIEPER